IITCVMTPQAGCFTASTANGNPLTMIVNPILVPSVSINAIPGNSICAGTSVTFTAFPVNGGSTPSYQWKKNGINTGTNSSTFAASSFVNNDIVTCVLTSNATCASPTTATSNQVPVTVDVNLTPTITISSVSGTTICQGTAAVFNTTITNGGNIPSYQWMIDGVNAGTNSPSFTTVGLTNGNVISCRLTSNSTCLTTNTATSNTISVIVNPVLTSTVSIGATSLNICSGTTVTFTATPFN